MCEFRDQVECRKYYLERYFSKGSCHLVELTWVTHLLRTAFRLVEVECILRAKQQRHLKFPELPSWVLMFEGAAHLVEEATGWKAIVEVGMVVLVLATSHSARLLQVRRDDQSRYPPNSWVASLAVDSWVGHCPLLEENTMRILRRSHTEGESCVKKMQWINAENITSKDLRSFHCKFAYKFYIYWNGSHTLCKAVLQHTAPAHSSSYMSCTVETFRP